MINVLAVIIILLTPVAMLFNGIVISILWEWFVVTQFALPSLSIPAAIGLGILINWITFSNPVIEHLDDNQKETYFSSQVFTMLLMPWYFLFMGWIITLFM